MIGITIIYHISIIVDHLYEFIIILYFFTHN
jgi:hypothetical protein